MDFTLFFDALDKSLFEGIAGTDTWYEHVHIYDKRPIKWTEKHLVILGVPEERGTQRNQGVVGAANEIRKRLYRLKKGKGAYKIVDLGNLRGGMSLEETYARLRQSCEFLLKQKVIPIILGGSHDLTLGQFWAYEKVNKLINLVNVDACIDIEETPLPDMSTCHVHRILTHQPDYLFAFSHLGYQSYLNSAKTLETLEKRNFDAYSVGQMRDDLNEIEPVVRNADMLSFDLTAIKMSDAVGNRNAQNFGLTGEEACQICWFAGLSERLSSIGFYEYNPAEDVRHQTASLIATMIWYFVEGYYHRTDELNFHSNAFMKYVVSRLNNSSNIIFYKHKVTQKWWMEVPYPETVTSNKEKMIVPCSYKDYQKASRGDIPDRWLMTYNKLG